MSRQQKVIEHPPQECPNCKAPRIGIQEGIIYFKCKSTLNYNVSEKPKFTKALECNLG